MAVLLGQNSWWGAGFHLGWRPDEQEGAHVHQMNRKVLSISEFASFDIVGDLAKLSFLFDSVIVTAEV